MEYRILNSIKSPADVKKLSAAEINILCEEMRTCIINTVSKNGGHLASNLGAVELTVALHRAFSAPEDSIIFDVGHQSYPHKLLTGRFDIFSTLRTEGGISGFMRPQESIYDPFVTGHSSNSISAAYGIYKSKCISGKSGTAVAVIGDGAMTGGMAYEALNNAGSGRSRFIVILNDNKMSISRSVGALASTFTRMRNKPRYHYFKFAVSDILVKIPLIGRWLRKAVFTVKEAFKNLVYRNNIFTSLGFNYLGPVDGHDVAAMESLFTVAQDYTRPSVIHVVTVKGKGYSYAESKPKSYHGVSPFDTETGAENGRNQTFSAVAGKMLCELAAEDNRICAVTAAMTEGTGLTAFSQQFKNRFFDVGIAEEHAVTFSAGLATGGMKPFFAVYSTFLQRGYDQILHDAAIASVPVRFLVDRAGIVGEDGESHQGLFDVAFLSTVPGMTVYSPAFYDELEALIKSAVSNDRLCAIRYPRGCENKNFTGEIKGDYTLVKNGSEGCIVTYGRLFSNAVEASSLDKKIDVLKLNRVYPLPDGVCEVLSNYRQVDFFEEGILSGGIGEKLAAELMEHSFRGEYHIHAVENEFVPSANVTSAIKKCGLDSKSMYDCF